MTPRPIKSLKTQEAAAYITERGVQVSRSYLEKARTRGPDDQRDRGPDFTRDPHGVCWYDLQALDRYADERLRTRQFRTAAPVPANFARRA
jgi:hypothetical protein